MHSRDAFDILTIACFLSNAFAWCYPYFASMDVAFSKGRTSSAVAWLREEKIWVLPLCQRLLSQSKNKSCQIYYN